MRLATIGREDFSNVPAKKGDRIKMMTSGGGGYGSPLERDPEQVLRDVLHGYISPQRAREPYGVALQEVQETSLTQTYTIDPEATWKLRERLR